MRQRARITYLAEGDTNTRFFHLQACHRSRKNHITKLQADDAVLFRDEEMANAVLNHFDSIFGSRGELLNHIKLEELDLQPLQDVHLDHCFSKDEIWQAIAEMPTDKALGPDGFTGLFLRNGLANYQGRHF